MDRSRLWAARAHSIALRLQGAVLKHQATRLLVDRAWRKTLAKKDGRRISVRLRRPAA